MHFLVFCTPHLCTNPCGAGKSHRLRKNLKLEVLPDDGLLEVFDFYRMYGESLFPPRIKTTWKWHVLAHVCQRWRRIIYASPRRLDLQLICTRGTPVRKHLCCWPAFPISIDFFSDITSDGTRIGVILGPAEEDNVIAALEHPGRVRRVGLTLTPSQLLKVSTAMQGSFPALTSLRLRSIHGNGLVLPDDFLGGSAPRLRNISLLGIPFPELPTLLSSASDLVELRLGRIPEAGYISPVSMAVCLGALTRLETLLIGFQSPTCRPSPRHTPPLTRTVLPALTEFRFRGVTEYLEDFVAQIHAPRLLDLKITYFNQLDFQVPQLSQFLRRQEILNPARLNNVHLEFSRSETCIKLTSSYQTPSRYSPPEGPGLDLQILSEGPDWQTSHLNQMLRQCFVELSDMDHLSVGDEFSGPDQHDGMDDTESLELLSLFTSVKSLLISEKMAGYITHMLDRATSEVDTELLPALCLLHIRPGYQSAASVEEFLSLSKLSRQPITIVNTQQEFDQRRSLLTEEETVGLRS